MAGSEFTETSPLCRYHVAQVQQLHDLDFQKSPSFKYSILFVGPRILIFDSENKVTVVTVAL